MDFQHKQSTAITKQRCGKLVMRDVNGAANLKEYALEKYFALIKLTGVERTAEPWELPAMSRGGEPGKIGERALPVTSSHLL